jgi:hypothetical protein
MNGQMMRKNITAMFAALAFGLPAFASPSSEYINTGTVTNSPVIDAAAFVNSGLFEAVIPYVGEQVIGGDTLDTETSTPYFTRNTLYYTNVSGATMLGMPGFLFETVTATGTNSARYFYNEGAIVAVDTQSAVVFGNNNGQNFFQNGTGIALPSEVLISASNILNGPNGSITVGADGLLQMYGKNIANNNSALVAGDLTGNDPYDETAIAQAASVESTAPGATTTLNYFTAPPTFFDLWWGGTNITGTPGLLDLGAVALGDPPPVNVTVRGDGYAYVPNFNGFAAYVYSYPVSASNIYYNIVCVNTNFANSNIAAQVKFYPNRNRLYYFVNVLPATGTPEVFDPNAMEAIVQFSEPCTDVISGQPVSSSIFLLDDGAAFSNNVTMFTNTAWLSDYARPGYFEVLTKTPIEWGLAVPENDPSDAKAANLANLITGSGAYGTYILSSTTPPGEAYTVASYAVQVGWDPELLNGVFPSQDLGASVLGLDIPDPTAEPARIDIEGSQVDLTDARIRAEGLVTLAATNLAGGATTAVDWGSANASLGATNGSLLVSNIFPQSFTRLRGDLFAWSANWYLTQTNAFVTNSLAFHLLVVDQSLQGSFNPTVRNLALTGQKSIDVEDPLTVINQALFETSNLTINASNHFTQNASSFTGTNVPVLKELVVSNNGVLAVDNVLDLGLDPTTNQISPVDRRYAISGIGNFGQIEATTILLQSGVFENDGIITTSNGGSMTIEAQTLDMGLVTNQRNSMVVEGNLILSAVNIGVTNSSLTNLGGSLTLQTTSDGQITDFVPNTPTTSNVLNNFWQVTDGFNLPVKPATGDLFGTTIETIAANSTIAQHIWAGRGDYTNVADGFADNVVIGQLILSRQSAGAELHFSGAGTSNGLYVDYLELDPSSLSYSDYRDGLVIDTNLTIYFADGNFPIDKVTSAYPGRLVWVSNFWGPNSSTWVTNESNGQACLVSDAVVKNQDPDYPGDNNPFPLNPAGGAWLYGANNECPAVTLVTENTAGFAKQAVAPVKGTYNGLFYDTNQLLSANSGFFTFTLSKNGAFSGRLLMGPANYTFSGSGSNKFNPSGAAKATAKHGSQSLTVNLQLVNTTDGRAGVQGQVSNGTWAAQLLGDLEPVWTAKNPSPYEGRYTMVLTNGGTNSVPGGDSYGSLTVSKQGVLSVAGKLADGNAFSQSVPVSTNGLWPFYTYVAGGKDFLLGWVSFQYSDSGWTAFQNSEATGITMSDPIFWSKASASKDRYYPAGFTNTFNLAGAPYVMPGKNSSGLSLTDPAVILSGGGLVSAVTTPVAYNGKLKYSANNLTLSINPTVGSFTGQLKLAEGSPSVKMDGVVLQNQGGGGGFGFFLGTNGESGAVLLQSQ